MSNLVECVRCGDFVPLSETSAEGQCDYCHRYHVGPPPEYEEELFGCLFPSECLMPGDHMKSECHTVEMVEEYERWTRS